MLRLWWSRTLVTQLPRPVPGRRWWRQQEHLLQMWRGRSFCEGLCKITWCWRWTKEWYHMLQMQRTRTYGPQLSSKWLRLDTPARHTNLDPAGWVDKRTRPRELVLQDGTGGESQCSLACKGVVLELLCWGEEPLVWLGHGREFSLPCQLLLFL